MVNAARNNSDATPAIEARNIVKSYSSGRRTIQALRGVSMEVRQGEYVSVTGPSGCGKSTLLNLLGGLDLPEDGSLWVLGTDLSARSQDNLARWRGENVGIIFQFFQLMPTLTALENVMLPIDLRRSNDNAMERAAELLRQVGLDHLRDHLPSELSGGEQQRVAIARALANRPRLLLADEPTGNLDSESGEIVVQILEELCRTGTTLIVVTHDKALAQRARRRIAMLDGQIIQDSVETHESTPVGGLQHVRTAS